MLAASSSSRAAEVGERRAIGRLAGARRAARVVRRQARPIVRGQLQRRHRALFEREAVEFAHPLELPPRLGPRRAARAAEQEIARRQAAIARPPDRIARRALLFSRPPPQPGANKMAAETMPAAAAAPLIPRSRS